MSAVASPAQLLKGKVVDADGKPLVGVSVITNIPEVGTFTDTSGEFTLKRTAGITRITFSSVGYESQQFKVENLPTKIVLKGVYYRGGDILVSANRAEKGITPIAFSNVSQKDIKRDYTVEEFPLLLQTTPNLYSYSDGGGDLGYSYTKIRGFDDKRIVTYINGVPLNDPEDHATYFVDLPDFASNVSDIQVQRGVGNSLYGDASFGGAINIVTSSFNQKRSAGFTAGYGEYTSDGKVVSDIYKKTFDYTSGLVNGKWSFAGRFSKQKTGGYRHNSWYNGWAYYFSVGRLDPHMSTELFIYGGPMRMHLAYDGVPESEIKKDRRANPMTYDNQTDNFNQPHYMLRNIYHFHDKTTLFNTLYYIHGSGYYEQFKNSQDFSDYNINSSLIDINPTDSIPYNSGNLVRQKWVVKDQTGLNTRLDIEHSHGKHSLGGSFYFFDSKHWGQVVWAQHLNGPLEPRHHYYQHYGKKLVSSIFSQEYYKLTDRLSTQITAQLRYQRYAFNQDKIGAFKGYIYNLDWLFFSPRIGFNYTTNEALNFYTNFSIASRTPADDAIYDASHPDAFPSLQVISNIGDSLYEFGDPTAKSERVYDMELGVNLRQKNITAGVNLYWMEFRNEIIPYGGIDDNGIPITINADRSVHAGVELTSSYKPYKYITFSGNFAYNYNRIKDYTGGIDVYLPDWSSYRLSVNYKDKKIAGFPDYLTNLMVDYNDNHWQATMRLRVIGKQYMELYNIDSLAIDPYTVASVSASYKLENFLKVGNVTFMLRVNNLFDKKYKTSGYGWTYGMADGINQPVSLIHEAEYFVAAERTFYGQLKMEFF